MYDYHNNAVFAVNETRNDAENLKASIRVFDLGSKLLFQKDVVFSVNANKSVKVLELAPPAQAVFLDIGLSGDSGKQPTHNFYWLSEKPDEFAWDKTTWAYTPLKGFADFTGLNSLPQTEISVSVDVSEKPQGQELITTIENKGDKIAFFITLSLLGDTGNQISPIFWDDNYISLLPGEKREIRCSIPISTLKTPKPHLQIIGWNVGKQVLEINE
jgi:exo-1,4-beta-D-glucosaminidase